MQRKILPFTCRLVFDSPNRLPEDSGGPRIANLGQRVADKVALCQLNGGLLAEMDILSALE